MTGRHHKAKLVICPSVIIVGGTRCRKDEVYHYEQIAVYSRHRCEGSYDACEVKAADVKLNKERLVAQQITTFFINDICFA